MLAATLATSLALAMLAQDCLHPGDRPAVDPGESCTVVEGTLSLRLADEPGYSDRPVIDRGACGEYTLYTSLRYLHESGEVIPEAMAYGRRVRVCTAHYGAPVVVFGGSRPGDWDFLMAVEGSIERDLGRARAGRSYRESPAGFLVRVGLAASTWKMRDVSHGLLVEMGVAAIPALLVGITSRDCEVRTRCTLILNEIRYGKR